MTNVHCLLGPLLRGKVVIHGFSGGPDAAALAYHLSTHGARVVPVYINYRKQDNHPKTVKDLRCAHASAAVLALPCPTEIRSALGTYPTSERNRFFIEVLARHARVYETRFISLGTLTETTRGTDADDVCFDVLSRHGKSHGVEILTWDSFRVTTKAESYSLVRAAKDALFATTSCQLWWNTACGNCFSCIARHDAFMEALGSDPTTYREGSKAARASA